MGDYSYAEDYDPLSVGATFAADDWRRSARCEPNGGNCVEVNLGAGVVGMRDSKLDDSPVLRFDSAEWAAFVDAVKAGQFDL